MTGFNGSVGDNGQWPQNNPWADEEFQPAPAPSRPSRTGLVIAAAIVSLLLVSGILGVVLLGGQRGESTAGGPTSSSAGGDGRDVGQGDGTGSPQVPTSVPSAPLSAAVVGTSPGDPRPPASFSASCEAPSSVDDGGDRTTFVAGNAFDADPDTAWRCDGGGGGELRFDFAEPTAVSGLGLIPGYAKIDPSSGVNRFSENHTVTEAVWRLTLADGSTVSLTQEIPNPRPEMSWLKLSSPQQVTGGTLTITGTGNPGAVRNYTPVSEVVLTD